MAPLQLHMLDVCNGFLEKSDGRDKLTATLQYVLMFLSGGNPGLAKDMQVKIAAARKVFRVMKPLEVLTPVIKEPYLPCKKPLHTELLPKLKSLFMAVYFGCDNLVWLGSVNVIKDKTLLDRFQKASLYGWFFGSLTTIMQESQAFLNGSLAIKQDPDEADEAWVLRKIIFQRAVRKRLLVLVHAIVQALLATGLLQLRPFKPRTTAFFGIVASALNCYMLLPTLPSAPAAISPAKDKPATKVA